MTFLVRLKNAKKPTQSWLRFEFKKLRDPDVGWCSWWEIRTTHRTARWGHGHPYDDYHLQYSSDWCSQHYLFSILFYPITLEGRRGTTDEFATIPFHLDLFSTALVELAKSIPVHSLILSSYLVFWLPLFLFPFTVPCAGPRSAIGRAPDS